MHRNRGAGLLGGMGCTQEVDPAASLPVVLSSLLNPEAVQTWLVSGTVDLRLPNWRRSHKKDWLCNLEYKACQWISIFLKLINSILFALYRGILHCRTLNTTIYVYYSIEIMYM